MKITNEYRPHTWSDMVGQENVVRSLQRQSEAKDFSNVYIFHGHFGCGKTTAARILAMSANCENPNNGNPCGCCKNCQSIMNRTTTDYFELDAASRSGVDDARSLIESVSYFPVELYKKVYIIDEVQRMSANAFDALLKTLEEPPEYAMFILCTTAFSSIPSTITSRAAKYHFKGLAGNLIVDKLKSISAELKREVDTDALELIVRHSNSALRDAEMNLEQAFRYTDGRIDKKLVENMLSVVGEDVVVELVEAIFGGNVCNSVRIATKLFEESNDLGNLIDGCRSILCDAMQFSCGYTEVLNKCGEIRAEHVKKIASLCNDIYKYRALDKSFARVAAELRKDYVLDVFLCSVVDMTIEKSYDDLVDELARLSKRLELLESQAVKDRALNSYSDAVENDEHLQKLYENSDVLSDDVNDNIPPRLETQSEDKPMEQAPLMAGDTSETAEEIHKDEAVAKAEVENSNGANNPLFTWQFDKFFFGGDTPEDDIPTTESKELSTDDNEVSPADFDVPPEEFFNQDDLKVEYNKKENGISLLEACSKDAALSECVKNMFVQEKDGDTDVLITSLQPAIEMVKACIEAYHITKVRPILNSEVVL